jgi:hypothetical protein
MPSTTVANSLQRLFFDKCLKTAGFGLRFFISALRLPDKHQRYERSFRDIVLW